MATAAEASPSQGSCPQGEVPTIDADALRKIIHENDLREAKAKEGTQSEGSTRFADEAGDTVHGKVDEHKAQQGRRAQRSFLKR